MKTDNLKNFKKLVSNEKSGWLEKTKWNLENEAWLEKSAKIAARILREIRAQKPVNGMTQKMMAKKMNVTPQYINKIVKGQENLTLETISRIEQVLGITLMDVPSFEPTQIITEISTTFNNEKIDRNKSVIIGKGTISFKSVDTYAAGSEVEYIPDGTYGY